MFRYRLSVESGSLSGTKLRIFALLKDTQIEQNLMGSIWDIPFIVTYVETAGTYTIKNRIMAIACMAVKFKGKKSEVLLLAKPLLGVIDRGMRAVFPK